jgi:hypothetical protein
MPFSFSKIGVEFKSTVDFSQVSNRSVFVWCVRSALEHQSDPSVQNWLHSTQLSQILVSLTRDICSSKTTAEESHILRCCLTKTKDGGSYSIVFVYVCMLELLKTLRVVISFGKKICIKLYLYYILF